MGDCSEREAGGVEMIAAAVAGSGWSSCARTGQIWTVSHANLAGLVTFTIGAKICQPQWKYLIALVQASISITGSIRLDDQLTLHKEFVCAFELGRRMTLLEV